MGERGRLLDHVLAVIQDQQHLPVADRGDEPVRQLRVRCRTEQRIPQPEPGECRLLGSAAEYSGAVVSRHGFEG